MIRLGDAIYTYVSEYDPQAGGSTVCSAPRGATMPEEMLIGVGLTSHAAAATGEIVVDQIRIDEAWHSLDLCQSKACVKADQILSLDFTSTSLNDQLPCVSKNATTFKPSVSSGRLRMADEKFGDMAAAVWLKPWDETGLKLGRRRIHAEFDVYMSARGSRRARPPTA